MISYLNLYGSDQWHFLNTQTFSHHDSGGFPSWVPDWRKSCHCDETFIEGMEARRNDKAQWGSVLIG
jgi:hypothetical protein